MFCFKCKNECEQIVNKFLLVGDKSMPEMHVKKPGFTYRNKHLPQTKRELKILCRLEVQTGSTVHRNELYKACFQHDMGYGKSKDLATWTQSDKFLRDKALKIVSNPKYDSYQRRLASIVYK